MKTALKLVYNDHPSIEESEDWSCRLKLLSAFSDYFHTGPTLIAEILKPATFGKMEFDVLDLNTEQVLNILNNTVLAPLTSDEDDVYRSWEIYINDVLVGHLKLTEY